MSANKVISFNLPVDDMDRAVFFYREVFGWKIDPIKGSGGDYHHMLSVSVDDNGVPKEPGAINGGLFSKGTHGIKNPIMEIVVDSIDEIIRMATSRGGKVVLEKKKLDGNYFAIIKDAEGNHLGLWEEEKM